MSAARRRPSDGRGAFIVLEGLDGAGTTTQAQRLSSALRESGQPVLLTRQPSDGPLGTMLRQALTGRLGLPGHAGPLSEDTLALMFAADRLDHLAATIEPALARGEVVICDRYVLSSLAYQGSALPTPWIESLNERALRPDLTLFLEVDVKVASGRRGARGSDPELFEQDERQRKVARQYQSAIRRRTTRERIVRLDGSAPVEEVTAAALEAIGRALGIGPAVATRRRVR